MNYQEILLIAAIILSAFFSGSETAYTAAGRLAMEVYRRHGRTGARAAHSLYNRPTLLFSTTLVGNNLVGVIYSSLAALILTRWGFSLQAILVISPLVILILGEVLPKTIAREHPEKWAMLVGWPLRITHWVLWPFIMIARASSNALLFLFGVRDHGDKPAAITLSELRGLWGEMHQAGELDTEEAELLDHVVALRDRKMHEVMTPRVDIVALPADATLEEVEKVVTTRGHSRIPIYEESLDQIIGAVLAKDLLNDPPDLASITRPVLVIPEQATVSRFLGPFRRGQVGLAVIVDEYGGTAGLVTLEDVLEQLVGDIEDEHDPQEGSGRLVAKGAWLIPGRAYLDAVERDWGILLPEGDYETVAGLVLDRLGYIPEIGETVEAGPWSLRIVSADSRRIKRVLIRRIPSGKR